MDIYTEEEKRIIKKDLSCTIKSDYGPSKNFIFYKKDGTLPLMWAIENMPSYKIPKFKINKINKIENDIVLKELQTKCMKEIDNEFLKDVGGGIINLSTGGGKTVLSLYTIAKYSLKTLIIVNTVELMEQWKESIKKFLPSATVGIIRSNVFDKNKDITIGMLQTISMRNEYTSKDFEIFSLCFIDECHHLSSEVFSEALFKCRTKYTFGLSATVERRDGLEYVFRYHLGDIIFSDKELGIKKQKTEVKTIYYKGKSSIPLYLYSGKPKISSMITNISEDKERNDMLIQYLLSLKDDRKVLVLSDRISQLNYLNKNLGKDISGLFIGKTSKEEKSFSKTKKILLATYNIASEGFDHPELNCLLFATPRSNIIQAIGRIFRKKHEINPLIIDVIDQFSVFPYQYKKRKLLYSQQLGYRVNEDNEGNEEKQEDRCEFD